MFSTPRFNVFNTGENAVKTRKLGISDSGRKPLEDRSPNRVQTKLKSQASKNASTKTFKKTTGKSLVPLNVTSYNTASTPRNALDLPDYLLDISSFKDVEDTYQDVIWPKPKKLSQYEIFNHYKPPTPASAEYDPFVIDIPDCNHGRNCSELQPEIESLPAAPVYFGNKCH